MYVKLTPGGTFEKLTKKVDSKFWADEMWIMCLTVDGLNMEQDLYEENSNVEWPHVENSSCRKTVCRKL